MTVLFMCGRPPLSKIDFRRMMFPGQVHSCVRPVRAARKAAGHDGVGGSEPHQDAALEAR
jgi:hypothetical protein